MSTILGVLLWFLGKSYTIGRIYQQAIDKVGEAAKDIVDLSETMRDLVAQKEREHTELRQDVRDTNNRIERHLEWHEGTNRMKRGKLR